ncbi:MAG TPA: efflux RND transporter periplasmic adaptor subunit [Steroidobacteraceae bacterium]|nr:efflux RND transporter periplasmic adaptor subunit [Steroidobacteraceae bacterium]
MRLATVAAAALLSAGCEKAAGTGSAKDSEKPAALTPLLLSGEDLLPLGVKSLSSGPTITGSILPEKRADLRAEVSAVVLTVFKENGDPVKKGQLLVQLDDTAIRDTLSSAQTAAEAASQAFDQAQRQYERMVKLREGGLVSAQQLEDAEVRRNSTQSDREAAKSRLVAAQQQQARTMVRAPFDGIVSDRQVSGGDTAQVGKQLMKVIDPSSLRFEGFISADSIGTVHPGQAVAFRVHGFEGREFRGTITRVNPAANATTRQVEVLVNFAPGQQQPGIAGLYAEGRVEVAQRQGLTIPAGAIARDGDNAFAWKVAGGKLHKTQLKLGDRDPRSGEYIVDSGLAAGDTVLRYPSSTLHDQQPVNQPGK